MFNIEIAYETLSTELSLNWINSYAFESQEQRLQSLTEISSKLLETSRVIYYYFNLSVIEGEYIKNDELVRNKIAEIESAVKQIQTTEIDSTSENQNLVAELIKDNFSQFLLYSLKQYQHLIDIIYRKIDGLGNSITILDVFRDELHAERSRERRVPIEQEYSFFIENILLARIDHNLVVDQQILRRLILSLELLDQFDIGTALQSYLKQKCSFLIYKIYYRFKQKKQTYEYVIDFIRKEIDIDQSRYAYFNSFKQILDSHYSDDQSVDQFRISRIKKFHENVQSGGIQKLCDYHAVVKHYKDDKKNLERLGNLLIVFKDQKEKTKAIPRSKFDSWAYNIVYLYFLNNEFSLLIDRNKVSFDDWLSALHEIESQQESVFISNYFIYEKGLMYLDRKLSDGVAQLMPNLENLEKYLRYYKELLQKFKDCVQWCEEKCFLTFQLTYDECVLPVELTDITGSSTVRVNGFLASSFVLPINYDELKEKGIEYNSTVLKYRTIIDIQTHLRRDKEEIKLLKEKAESSDKRSIEILSIFAAIVLFVAGDIQIFTKVANLKQAIQFMFLFGFVLGGFVLLIWFITRNDAFKWKSLTLFHYIIIILYLAGLLTSVFILRGNLG